MPEPMAEMHRAIGRAEHGVENRLLDLAKKLPDTERARDTARKVSAAGRRHEAVAERLERGSGEG